MDGMTDVLSSADLYPYTYPTSSRWVFALTFLPSALWIKARGRLVLSCCLFGLMEDPSLSPCHYRLSFFSGSCFKLFPADISEYFFRVVVFLFLGKRVDQRQYLFADYDQCLHLFQRIFLPRFQVMV